MENLIKSVHNHPAIWKTDCQDFKTLEVRVEAWEEVAKECNIDTVREAKRCWKNLRDMFRQVLVRKHNGVSSKVWKHEGAMEFLIPHMIISKNSQNSYELEIETERVRVSNDPLSRTDDQSSDLRTDDVDTDENETEEQDELYSYLPSPKKTKREYSIRVLPESELNSSNYEGSDKSDSVTENPNNAALESFFTSMCQTTLSLPDHLQLKVQRSIFDVVMNAKVNFLREKDKKLKKKGSKS